MARKLLKSKAKAALDKNDCPVCGRNPRMKYRNTCAGCANKTKGGKAKKTIKVIISGPKGTGKSLLASALASVLRSLGLCVDVIDEWDGEEIVPSTGAIQIFVTNKTD